jgi:hypothetical protein
MAAEDVFFFSPVPSDIASKSCMAHSKTGSLLMTNGAEIVHDDELDEEAEALRCVAAPFRQPTTCF